MAKEAEIIAVGSELLTPQRVDTNSLLVTEQLNLLGVEVTSKHVVGDDRERLTWAIQTSVKRSHIVILIGGLGPTEDDVTREAAAAALGRKLVLSLEQESVLINRFRQINRPMAKNNLRQAYLLEDAEALPNPNGTAPGQFISTDRGALAMLPGPPRELKPMVINELIPRLSHVVPPQAIRVRAWRITGIGESDLDALISPVYKQYKNPVTTVLSSPGDLFVYLRAQGENAEEADSLLRKAGDPIADLLGDLAYTNDPDEPLEAVVGTLLRKHRATICTAESVTGGMVAARLSEQAGSSDFFVGSFVTYNDDQKASMLGISRDLLSKHGAVSEQVARAMAEQARQRSRATYALSATGFAGPSGGTEFDPVGTVYLGMAGPQDTRVIRLRYGAGRYRIRMLSTQASLDLARKTLSKK